MPFGIKEIPIPESTRIDSYKAAEDLVRFDDELYSDSSKNYRKRKRNVDRMDEDIKRDKIEELFAPDNVNPSQTEMNKRKKKTFTDKSDNSDEIQNPKNLKKKNKVMLSSKKKSKRLNTELLSKKKNKQLSKKLKNPFFESIEKSECTSVDQCGSSVNSKWDVDCFVPSNSVKCNLEKLEKENKISRKFTLKKKTNSKPAPAPWLAPVLTRLEEQKNVS